MRYSFFRLFAVLVLLFSIAIPSDAVLKEKDLSSTLAIMRDELTTAHREQQVMLMTSKEMSDQLRKQLIDIMQKSGQNSLMLYSQKNDYVLNLAYACHEAIEQYNEFKRQSAPFMTYAKKSNNEIERYDSLIDVLSKMPVMALDEKAKVDRNVCLTLAVNIRRMLKDNNESLKEYLNYYERIEARLKNLNDYANTRYNEIQNGIFNNNGTNYFKILKELNIHWHQTKMAVFEKYRPLYNVNSQWDVRYIIWLFSIICIYGMAAFIINIIVVRLLATRLVKRGLFGERKETFFAKRTCIILATSAVTFAIILGIIKIFTKQNFIIMASSLLVTYGWLLGVILISLLLRVDGQRIKSSFKVYAPLMVIGFIVISFRIILIPNVIVSLIFPPILFLCTLWQWWVIRKHNKNIKKSDYYYTYISLFVFIASLICSWTGYTLMSVELLIWWIMQLTCILTITCVGGWIKAYAAKKDINTLPITKTWFYKLLLNVIIPICGVFSFMVAIYWAADVFNLSDLTWKIFSTKFIDTNNFRVSMFSLTQVIVLWFIFSYINNTVKAVIRLQLQKQDPTTAKSRGVMIINVLQVIIWGIWFIMSLAILHVNNTWLVVISGGLSTGVGFASKDILENIYYGISLMAGRIKIGDYIICDGTRGRVSSISYTSTMLETVDGSVIAFQNSQLFTKNYKNLTRNHGYELHFLEVGVAYGTDINFCKKILEDAIMKLDCIDKKRGVSIVLKEFADSSMILKILVWVPVLSQYSDDGKVLECVYNTLNEHNIEIPFPQRDLHIIKSE